MGLAINGHRKVVVSEVKGRGDRGDDCDAGQLATGVATNKRRSLSLQLSNNHIEPIEGHGMACGTASRLLCRRSVKVLGLWGCGRLTRVGMLPWIGLCSCGIG